MSSIRIKITFGGRSAARLEWSDNVASRAIPILKRKDLPMRFPLECFDCGRRVDYTWLRTDTRYWHSPSAFSRPQNPRPSHCLAMPTFLLLIAAVLSADPIQAD